MWVMGEIERDLEPGFAVDLQSGVMDRPSNE